MGASDVIGIIGIIVGVIGIAVGIIGWKSLAIARDIKSVVENNSGHVQQAGIINNTGLTYTETKSVARDTLHEEFQPMTKDDIDEMWNKA